MEFWTQDPKFFLPLQSSTLKVAKDLYDYQIGHLASALLIDDYDPGVEIDSCSMSSCLSNFVFPKDALISGSFVMHWVAKNVGSQDIQFDDIDIYFKKKEDAQEFLKVNKVDNEWHFDFQNPMCAYGQIGSAKYNLIYGVEYESAANLISRFDIRACSMAIDPNKKTLYVVRGSIEDATRQQISFNPVPRGVSVRRLAKYLKKGFNLLDSHQSVFFRELLCSDIYSPELELMTKEY